MASSIIGAVGSQIVCPVFVCFSPTTATISPALKDFLSSRLLACITNIRPIRSFRLLFALITVVPDFNSPE